MTHKKNCRKPSKPIHASDLPLIRKLLDEGMFQNRIAAMFDVNPGRISEIKTGKHPLCGNPMQPPLPF